MTRDFITSLPQGKVCGHIRAHDIVFHNIPYGVPPVGLSRFTAPEMHSGWSGVRDGRYPGPTAQRVLIDSSPCIPERIIPGDDTLNLSIYVPRDAMMDDLTALPVLVWIHGGSFHSGSNTQPWFDGAAFTKSGIIVVSVGYRLGLDGFLTLPDAPRNRALLDWILALTWVQNTISYFGGDPRKVTVAGQSAGGCAVLTLLASPQAKGLFSRAIAESPASIRGSAQDGSGLRRAVQGLLRGQAPHANYLGQQSNQMIDQLLRSTLRVVPRGLVFYPVSDPHTLPLTTREVLAMEPSDIPLMVGSTTEEFDNIAAGMLQRPSTLLGNISLWLAGLGAERRKEFLSRHAPLPLGKLLGRAATDAMIRSAVTDSAEGRASLPGNSPTWVYQYSWTGRRGAVHCTDVPLFFGLQQGLSIERILGPSTRLATLEDPSRGRLADPIASQLGDTMHASWSSFVKTGDPGWQPYTVPDRAVQIWDGTVRTAPDALKDVREIWSNEIH